MYGFGDDQNPYTESVDIIEDLVIEFITEMTQKYVTTVLLRSTYKSATVQFLEQWKLVELAECRWKILCFW